MPRITDYNTIEDGSFTLGIGGDIDQSLTFSLPTGVDAGSRSILAYRIDPVGEVDLNWTVRINGAQVHTLTLNGEVFRTLHEVVQNDVLRVGDNTVTFRVNNGSGQIGFSDVVLWWQHNI